MFLTKFLFCLLILGGASYDYDVDYGEEYEDHEDDYTDEVPAVPVPRVRRFPSRSTIKTLNEKEIREVKEAIKQLLNIDESSLTETLTDTETESESEGLTNRTTQLLSLMERELRAHGPVSRFLRADNDILDGRTIPDAINNLSDATATDLTAISKLSTMPTAKYPINVPALLDLIAALAEDYETNLTKKLNESLSLMSIPTCETFTGFKRTTSEYDANATGTVIAKCFVCGLEETGVPYSAPCADAFAGDFIPMVPVDPTARAQISNFRKYCKYQNIRGYQYNSTQPRAIFGRWTGGCSVRWIDLSGIYTQRTCRSRHQAIMGKHFGSKRMARLEMTLMTIDNGCIVSPMATLVPLSRGISLFARFHACVCTGSWCNKATTPTSTILLLLKAYTVLSSLQALKKLCPQIY